MIKEVPRIYGNAEELEAFCADIERYGYSMFKKKDYPTLVDFSAGSLKLNGNSYQTLCKENNAFKKVVTVSEIDGYSALDNKLNVACFYLPKDYQIALEFMSKNMRIFNGEKIEEYYEIY